MADNKTSIIISAVDQTGAALKSAEAGLAGLGAQAGKLSDILSGFAALAGATAFGGIIKGAIDAADELDELSQKSGATVESLSAMKGVAKIAGADMEQVAGGLAKLSKNMVEAANGSGDAAKVLTALGISVTDNAGKMKSTDQVMVEFAKSLQNVGSGTEKVAAAQLVLGKSGATLLPFLNDLAAAGDLQVKVTAEQAAAAANLNDNIKRLAVVHKAWANTVAMEVVPVADQFVQALLETATGANGTKKAVEDMARDGTLKAWAQDAAKAAAFVVDALDGVSRVTQGVGLALGAMAAQTKLFFTGDIKGAQAVGAALYADLDKLAQKELFSETLSRRMADIGPMAQAATPGVKSIAAALGDAGEKAAKAAKAMADLRMETILRNAKEAAKELDTLAKAQEEYAKALYAGTDAIESQAQSAERDLLYYGMTESAIQATIIARLEEARAIAAANGAYPEHLAYLDREIDARQRIATASSQKEFLDTNKRAAEASAREWEKFADDINRSLTDALYRSFESGGSFAKTFAQTLENTLKAALAKALINTVVTTGSNALNGVINALAGTSGTNAGAGANYLGLANNANSAYNLGSAAVNTYSALTTGAGAISGTASLASIYGAAGGDSLGAFIAMNPQWASSATSAGAAAGAEAGAAAGSASASASSAASYAGYAAALYQAYKGDYASASLTATGTYIGSMFGPWGAAIGALVGTLVGSFIQPGGGPKDNNRYSYSEGNYERLSGGSAGVLKEYSASAADQINGLAAMYGNDTRIAGREAWLSLDPRGTASTQLNLELFDQIGRKLYSRMDEYGGNIENVGRSSASLQENMARTMRDAVLLAVARADIGDAVTVALFDQFESGIKDLSATQGDMVIGALKMGWLDDVLGVVDEAQIGLSGVADAVANLMSIVPMKKVFDDLGVSIFAIGAQTEATLPALANLKKTITGSDGVAVTETFRETYLRTVNEFVAVANMLDAMGLKVSEAFKMSDVNNVLSMSDALVQLFGSIDAMNTSFNAYYENFYSAAEKSARSWELMQRYFDGLGLAMPKTREGFRDIVEDLIASGKISTESGQQIYKSLMDVQGAFASLTPELGNLTTAQAELEAQAAATAEALAAAAAAYAGAADAALEGIYGRADSGLSALTQAIDLEKQRASAARDAAGEQVSAINSLFGLLDNQISGLYGNVESASAAMAEQGMAFIGQAVTAARSGYMPDQSQLSDAIGSVRAGLSGKAYGSNFERDFDALSLAGSLSQIRAAGEKQLPVAEQALNAAESQLKALDESLAWYSKQVDQLKGINSNTALLGGSIAEMGDSLVAELRAQMSALNAAVLAGVGSGMLSGPEAAQRLAAGGVAQDKITSVGSKPVFVSSKGAVATADQFTSANGWQGSLDDAQKIISQTFATASPEKFYTSAIQVGLSAAMIDALYGFPAGTANDWAKAHNLPSFASGGAYSGGLALVGENGPELINFAAAGHVYTAPQTATLLGGGDGAKLGQLVEALTAEVKRLQGQLAEVGANTRRTADAVNGNPESPMLVESV